MRYSAASVSVSSHNGDATILSKVLILLVLIKENFDVRLLGAEQFLSPDQGVSGGNVGVFTEIHEQVGLTLGAVATFLQGLENTGFFQHFIHLTGST